MNKKSVKMLCKLASMPSPNPYTYTWSDARKRFTILSASQFFIGVMLDMGQRYEGAWDRGEYLVSEYFNSKNIWFDIADTHLNTLRSICKTGYYGGYFALRHHANKFAERLKANAKIMIDEYEGDPRLIWNVEMKDVEKIYWRFKEFNGIGDALAKMAQFILVRDYGVAGGYASRLYLKAKPDDHVRKVVYRMGVSPSASARDVVSSLDNIGYESQADLDAVLFNVGRKYCRPSNPKCDECPFGQVCSQKLD